MNRRAPVRTLNAMIDDWRSATNNVLRGMRRHHVLIALAAFGFMAPQGHAGAAFGLLLLLGVALARWRCLIRDVVRDRFFVAWCMLSIYLMIRAAAAALEFPETSWEQWEMAFRLALTGFYVVLVSWSLEANTRRVMWLTGAALSGYCVEVLVELDPGSLNGVLGGSQRYMLGVALPVGLAGAIAMVGLIAFLPRLIRLASRKRRIIQFILYTAVAASASLLVLAQVITQSRAVIGMLVVLVPMMIAFQFIGRSHATYGRTAFAAGYGIVIGLFILAVVLVGPRLVDKLERGYSKTAPFVLAGNLGDMPTSSLGLRIHLNMHGSQLAAERPWIGWGPGTSSTRDLSDRYRAEELRRMNHLHNTYLEIVVRLGLIGATLYLVAVGVLFRRAIRSRPGKGPMPSDVGMFVAAGSALMAGWGLIDFHLINWTFIVPLVLLAAVVHTYAARWSNDGRAQT